MLLEARAIRAIGVNCIPPALVAPALQVHLPSFPSAHCQKLFPASKYLMKTFQYLALHYDHLQQEGQSSSAP